MSPSGANKSRQQDTLYQKLSALHAWDGSQWHQLPSWAAFYLELGTIIGSLPDGGNRHVLAMAVPSRAFVCALVAAGVILARATGSSRHDQAADHLRSLKDVPAGTPVYLRQDKRRLRGIYQGFRKGLGGQYFAIQTEQRNSTEYLIPAKEAYKIEVIEGKIRLPQRQKGRAIEEIAPLLNALLDNLALRFSRETQIDCIIIGTRSVLKAELEYQQFAISPDAETKGTLLDILRPRPLLSSSAPTRSYLIPSSRRHVGNLAQTLQPHVVLFDGGLSYLNWAHVWHKPHSVIVLDRTESNFRAATAKINQHFVQYRLDDDHELDIPPVPAGVEVTTFQVN